MRTFFALLFLLTGTPAHAVYVERDAKGEIVGVYDRERSFATEWLDPENQEVKDFKNPPEEIAERARRKALYEDAAVAALRDKLNSANGSQIEAYVKSRIGAQDISSLAEAKAAIERIEAALAELFKLQVAGRSPPAAVKASRLEGGK